MSQAFQRFRCNAKQAVKVLVGSCCSCVFVVVLRVVKLLARSSPRVRKSPAQTIIILCLDHIGDVVLASAFLRELRHGSPKADITLVVSEGSLQVVKECPYVDHVLSIRLSGGPTILGNLGCLPSAVTLFRRHFRNLYADLVVVPRWGPDFHAATALVALISADRKIWFSTKSSWTKKYQNFGFDSFYTESVVARELEHEVEHSSRLLNALGYEPNSARLEFWLKDTDREFAEKTLGNLEWSALPIVAFGVGAKAAKRKWPVERYIEVARTLSESYDARFVLIGTAEDRAELQAMRKVLGEAVAFDGQVTLPQVAALIERCELFVGNDSGPMHIAAACGVPVIEVSCHPVSGDPYHDNSPARFGPWGNRSTVLRPAVPRNPCQSACEAAKPHCVLDVTAQQVSEAALRSLKLSSTAAGQRRA
jgi:ADP-heptose:LPS heptosyltransferase